MNSYIKLLNSTTLAVSLRSLTTYKYRCNQVYCTLCNVSQKTGSCTRLEVMIGDSSVMEILCSFRVQSLSNVSTVSSHNDQIKISTVRLITVTYTIKN